MNNQKIRLFSLVIKILILIIINSLAFNRLMPDMSLNGFWLLTCLLNALLGAELITPFFVRPVDALTYSITAIIAFLPLHSVTAEKMLSFNAYFVAIWFFIFILCLSIFSILFNKSINLSLAKMANSFRITLEYLGSPILIFTILLIYTGYAFHKDSSTEIIGIAFAWGLTIAIDPIKNLISAYNRILFTFKEKIVASEIGSIAAYQQPDIILVREEVLTSHSFASPIFINDSRGEQIIGITLDHVGREEGILLRCLFISHAKANTYSLYRGILQPDKAYLLNDNLVNKDYPILSSYSDMMGLIGQGSGIDSIQIEIISDESIHEGCLVEANIKDNQVLYQIIDGLTKKEIVEKKNTFGYVSARARKIGRWVVEDNKFQHIQWLPKINSPVRLRQIEDYIPKANAIGHFPGTNYTVEIEDINSLVTHNTAILGILGVGKSMLSIELVERMLTAGIKVICLDLTNQYEKELDLYYDKNAANISLEKIKAAGEKDREEINDNPEDGGSFPALSQAIFEDIKEFIESPTLNLKIYNPARLSGTKQISEPKSYNDGGKWHRSAGLYSLSPVEITEIISNACLDILSAEMTDKARVCLVYEEAHSLIPEWNSVVNDGDKTATAGTARAILQGRKYGLGCLLITQRTANVTKTILNQCNSIFAMRTFDNTGVDFISNYIGTEYANILSSLPERHAVYFGKSSSCENPVLIKLNDREIFKTIFRKQS